MGIDDIVSRNRPVAIVVALVILGGAGYLIWQTVSGGNTGTVTFTGSNWFYDVGSGELFTAPANQHPPIAAPSGSEGVRAIVYACTSCDDEAQRGIANLFKYTDEAQQRLVDAGSRASAQLIDEVSREGRLIAFVPKDGDEPQWIGMDHPHAMTVLEQINAVCGGNAGIICSP